MPKKLVISTLSLLSAITLAGSISGTLAWYQYSTRAWVAYTGTSARCSKLLQLSVDGINWNSNLTSKQLGQQSSFAPVTTGAQEKDHPLTLRSVPLYDEDGVTQNGTYESFFYAQPDRLQGLYENWDLASQKSYAHFKIFIKSKEVSANNPEIKLANEVFLTELSIQDADIQNSPDLSSAVRVHISTKYKDENNNNQAKNFLFAKETIKTDVGGFLDVDGQNGYDFYGFEWDEKQTCVYGGGTLVPATYDDDGNILEPEHVKDVPVQTSYLNNDSSIIAQEDDEGNVSGGMPIGVTSASDNDNLEVDITIWLEGWSPLLIGSQHSSIWDKDKYLDQNFNVNIAFAVQPFSEN